MMLKMLIVNGKLMDIESISTQKNSNTVNCHLITSEPIAGKLFGERLRYGNFDL